MMNNEWEPDKPGQGVVGEGAKLENKTEGTDGDTNK